MTDKLEICPSCGNQWPIDEPECPTCGATEDLYLDDYRPKADVDHPLRGRQIAKKAAEYNETCPSCGASWLNEEPYCPECGNDDRMEGLDEEYKDISDENPLRGTRIAAIVDDWDERDHLECPMCGHRNPGTRGECESCGSPLMDKGYEDDFREVSEEHPLRGERIAKRAARLQEFQEYGAMKLATTREEVRNALHSQNLHGPTLDDATEEVLKRKGIGHGDYGNMTADEWSEYKATSPEYLYEITHEQEPDYGDPQEDADRWGREEAFYEDLNDAHQEGHHTPEKDPFCPECYQHPAEMRNGCRQCGIEHWENNNQHESKKTSRFLEVSKKTAAPFTYGDEDKGITELRTRGECDDCHQDGRTLYSISEEDPGDWQYCLNCARKNVKLASKTATNWTMDGTAIENGFEVASAEDPEIQPDDEPLLYQPHGDLVDLMAQAKTAVDQYFEEHNIPYDSGLNSRAIEYHLNPEYEEPIFLPEV